MCRNSSIKCPKSSPKELASHLDAFLPFLIMMLVSGHPELSVWRGLCNTRPDESGNHRLDSMHSASTPSSEKSRPSEPGKGVGNDYALGNFHPSLRFRTLLHEGGECTSTPTLCTAELLQDTKRSAFSDRAPLGAFARRLGEENNTHVRVITLKVVNLSRSL